MFEEARRLARSLRKRPDEWRCDPNDWLGEGNLVIHRPTGWALWIGGGCRELQPVQPSVTKAVGVWLHPRRYNVLERLIIWHGGARRWYRYTTQRPRLRAPFMGEA